MIGKLFKGEMLFRTLSTTLFQIFSKIILNSKVSVKSILDPDDNFLEECLNINGLSMRKTMELKRFWFFNACILLNLGHLTCSCQDTETADSVENYPKIKHELAKYLNESCHSCSDRHSSPNHHPKDCFI